MRALPQLQPVPELTDLDAMKETVKQKGVAW